MFVLAAVLIAAAGGAISYFAPNIGQSHNEAQSYAKVESGRKVHLGGMPVGISVKSDGVIVLGLVEVETSVGMVKPNSSVETGDIIVAMNGKNIVGLAEMHEALAEYDENQKQMEITVIRAGKEKKVSTYPIKEIYTENYKLGFEVKEFAEGIGTVTYIKACGAFAALGHPLNSLDGTLVIPAKNGSAYECRIVGHVKGSKGKPGELKGMYITPEKPSGKIHTNSRFGVYGSFENVPSSELIEVGSRFSTKPGKAKMLTTLKDTPEWYDIEIVKTVPQGSASEKGMVIRVTDKRLLSQTGGIIQGMSGSPIVQDGKLVGAVTHVFVGEPSKGYAVYIDWVFS